MLKKSKPGHQPQIHPRIIDLEALTPEFFLVISDDAVMVLRERLMTKMYNVYEGIAMFEESTSNKNTDAKKKYEDMPIVK